MWRSLEQWQPHQLAAAVWRCYCSEWFQREPCSSWLASEKCEGERRLPHPRAPAPTPSVVLLFLLGTLKRFSVLLFSLASMVSLRFSAAFRCAHIALVFQNVARVLRRLPPSAPPPPPPPAAAAAAAAASLAALAATAAAIASASSWAWTSAAATAATAAAWAWVRRSAGGGDVRRSAADLPFFAA